MEALDLARQNLPDIAITDPDGCPAFFAQNVTGVTNGAAPDWMAKRLTAIGQNPISMLRRHGW